MPGICSRAPQVSLWAPSSSPAQVWFPSRLRPRRDRSPQTRWYYSNPRRRSRKKYNPGYRDTTRSAVAANGPGHDSSHGPNAWDPTRYLRGNIEKKDDKRRRYAPAHWGRSSIFLLGRNGTRGGTVRDKFARRQSLHPKEKKRR